MNQTKVNVRQSHLNVIFEVIMAVIMKNVVSWNITPCSYVTSDFSEEFSASIIKVKRIGELGTTLAVTSNTV
jgi:hypothetical protein